MKHLEKWGACNCQLAIMLSYRFGTKPLFVCIGLAFILMVVLVNVDWTTPYVKRGPVTTVVTTPTTRLSKEQLQNMSRTYRLAIEETLPSYNQRSHCHTGQVLKQVEHLLELNRFDSCGRIFYNRVPKCGSRSVLSTVKILADQLDYRQIASTKTEHKPYFDKVAYEDAFVLNFTTFEEPFFFSKHLHFVNFTRYRLQPPIYINVVRDPLERLLSHYFYSIYGSNGAPYSSPMTNKTTLEQCIQSAGRGCSSLVNTMVPFFCGHRRQCRQPKYAKQALNMAKRAVRDSYLVVGVQEDLYAFMQVLELLLPRFFTNATVVYNSTEESFRRKFATVKKPEVSMTTITNLKKMLAHEYDFYYFVKQRFYTLHKKVTSSRNSPGRQQRSRRKRSRNSSSQRETERLETVRAGDKLLIS